MFAVYSLDTCFCLTYLLRTLKQLEESTNEYFLGKKNTRVVLKYKKKKKAGPFSLVSEK